MRYTRYFIVSGRGESDTSRLNGFDRALMDAGIAQCNLVHVSSILPENAVEIEPIDFPAGTITHCVLAREDGVKGETVSAGIGWAVLDDYGIVAEDSGNYDEETLERKLLDKLADMADARGMEARDMKTRVVSQTNEREYGTVLAALIYTQ